MALPATVTEGKTAGPTAASSGHRAMPAFGEAETPPMFDLIELLFFAYRDFVGDADRLLADFSFGRAHHRVLHFVHRHPDLTVNALLDILKITKQSLNRVMKDLTDKRLIAVRASTSDRRRRLLHVTPEGCRLALELAHLQSERFRLALEVLPVESRRHAGDFLLGMIDPEERPRVMALISAGCRPDRNGPTEREPRTEQVRPRLREQRREHAA